MKRGQEISVKCHNVLYLRTSFTSSQILEEMYEDGTEMYCQPQWVARFFPQRTGPRNAKI